MKFIGLSKLGLKKFIRDKKNIVNIVLLSLIFSLVIFSISFKKSLNNYWDESIKKLVDYRTYVVTFDNQKYDELSAINKLKKYEHVIEAFPEKSYLISMKIQDNRIINEENNLFLVGTIDDPIKIVDGETLDSLSSIERPIICAKQFYPFIEYYQENYVIEKSMDISSFIGKKINMSFLGSSDIESFTLVGLYDAKENHTEGNVCYTKLDIVNDLNSKYQSDVFDIENPELNYIYMVLDNVDNEELVLSLINKDGFQIVMPTLSINKEMGNQIVSLIFIISTIMILLALIILIFFTIKKINQRKKDYAIMKTVGYSNFHIIILYIIEITFIFITSFILSLFSYIIMTEFFQKVYLFNKIVFYNFKIQLCFISLYVNLILCFVICMISILYFRLKILNLSIKSIIE